MITITTNNMLLISVLLITVLIIGIVIINKMKSINNIKGIIILYIVVFCAILSPISLFLNNIKYSKTIVEKQIRIIDDTNLKLFSND